MKSIFRALPYAILTSALLYMGCAHRATTLEEDVGREPAGEKFSFAKTCAKLTDSEKDDFRGLVLGDRQFTQAASLIEKMHKRFASEDPDQFGHPMNLEFAFNAKVLTDNAYQKIKDYIIEVLLGNCSIVRDGLFQDDWGDKKDERENKKKHEWLTKKCGVEDLKRRESDRPHPKSPRTIFTDYLAPSRHVPYRCDPKSGAELQGTPANAEETCYGDPFDVWLWVRQTNGIYDKDNRFTSPKQSLKLCRDYKFFKSIEDYTEKYLICFDAVMLNLLEYDYKKKEFVLDDEGKPKYKKRSKHFEKCLEGYSKGKVKVDDEGNPIKPEDPPPPMPPSAEEVEAKEKSKYRLPPAEDPKKQEDKESNVYSNKPRDGVKNGGYGADPSGAPGKVVYKGHPESTGTNPNGSKPRKACLPGDPIEWDGCKDSCISDLAEYVKRARLPVPANLSSKDIEKLYDDEKPNYVFEASAHQLRLLAQGHVVAATERKWVSPPAYNENVNQAALACRESRLKAALNTILKDDFVSSQDLDGAYDDLFGKLSSYADNLGRRMVDTTYQIKHLQFLINYLRYESGAHEITTLNAPSWFAYIPVIRSYAGAPIAISFGDPSKYQCNMFDTMPGDLMEGQGFPYSSKLIRPVDKKIREFIQDDNFRRTAFCTNDPECKMPYYFEKYLDQMDPKNFVKVDERIAAGGAPINISRIGWCDGRFNAAKDLLGMIMELVALYPALGHRDKDGDDPGPPLFDRIDSQAKLGVSEALRAEFAAKEAKRILPLIQADILKYVGRVCDDFSSGNMDSTYMAVLNGATLQGFDYCKTESGKKSILGLRCGDYEQVISCKVHREAKDWEAEKRVPAFLKQVAMTGLDALFVWGIASGGIGSIFTPKGVIVGGVSGVVFTAIDYGVSRWIASRSDALWDDYRRGVAGAMLEGVDSYANAITSIAAAHPKAEVKDFILGFLLGSVFSGKRGGGKLKGEVPLKGGALEPVRGGMHETPPEVFKELAEKIADYSEKAGDGVRFKPENLSELKSWMMTKAGEHPEFVGDLIRNMGEHLNKLSDAEYADLFSSAEGKTRLSRVNAAIKTRIKALAPKLENLLGKARERVRTEKIKKGKFDPKNPKEVANVANEIEVNGADIVKASEKLGPRERATLADAMEEIMNEKNPKKQAKLLDEFFKSLCGLASTCGLEIRGCL